MDAGRVSDFSIERILSPQLGPKPPVTDFQPDGRLQGPPGGFGLEPGSLRAPVPLAVPVPVPGCLQYQGLSFGEVLYPCGAAFQRAEAGGVFPGPGLYLHFGGRDSADAPPGCTGLQAPARQRGRARTVFTDGQTKQLEALFHCTDYPPAEARAELARSTGLSEETVRVWFKNRRARRKRQCSGSKVKSPSPPSTPCTGTDKRLFTAFL